MKYICKYCNHQGDDEVDVMEHQDSCVHNPRNGISEAGKLRAHKDISDNFNRVARERNELAKKLKEVQSNAIEKIENAFRLLGDGWQMDKLLLQVHDECIEAIKNT